MRALLLLVGALAPGCTTTAAADRPESVRAVHALLDDWHRAAARADGGRYFAAIAADGVFLGTDPGERWTKAAFRAYAEPHFARGRGWTYRPRDRHVMLARDGRLAWFDEKLDHASYGELRGTGVLRRTPAGWRIVHYNLGFAVPNETTRAVVDAIAAGR